MQPVEKDGETITLAAKYLQEKMKRPSLVREREIAKGRERTAKAASIDQNDIRAEQSNCCRCCLPSL